MTSRKNRNGKSVCTDREKISGKYIGRVTKVNESDRTFTVRFENIPTFRLASQLIINNAAKKIKSGSYLVVTFLDGQVESAKIHSGYLVNIKSEPTSTMKNQADLPTSTKKTDTKEALLTEKPSQLRSEDTYQGGMKVVVIGNTASHTQQQVRQPGMIETEVVGVTYENRQEVVALLRSGETVFLHREHGNPHDPNAIRVERQNGMKFGYLNRRLAAEIARSLDALGKQMIPAHVISFVSDYRGTKGRGVWICFSPPPPPPISQPLPSLSIEEKRFENSPLWQHTVSLVKQVYRITGEGQFKDDDSLKRELQAAAVSLQSRIAEGYEGASAWRKDLTLDLARNASIQLRSLLQLAGELGLIPPVLSQELCDAALSIRRELDDLTGI